jgi:hypothetical protein
MQGLVAEGWPKMGQHVMVLRVKPGYIRSSASAFKATRGRHQCCDSCASMGR